MSSGKDQGIGQDHERCFDELSRSIRQLNGRVDPAQLSTTAELIIQTMSGPWRHFHTPQHIFEVGEAGDEIEVLSALFHDLVYVQVDQWVSVNISRYISPFVKEIHSQLVILERWQLPEDPLFELVSQIFGFTPGQTLQPLAGQNEFLSAVVAAKCLEHALPLEAIAQITACIEATIPFRPRSDAGETAAERLFARLVATNQTFSLGWTEAQIHAVVERAVRLANRDVENFAYESAAEFLDNTWNLMPETNHDLSANLYTVVGFRTSLQKMEGFMLALKPETVFQQYGNEPDPVTYQRLIDRTQNNLDVARLYLGSKLLSIAVIEALSQRIGQEITLATIMGELPGRGLPAAQLENFLPQIPVAVPPATAVEREVMALLEKGRSKSSSYDVRNSPVATYIIKSIGFVEAKRLLVQAKEYFKKSIGPEEFLAMCDRPVVETIVQGVVQVFEKRKAAMAGLNIPITV